MTPEEEASWEQWVERAIGNKNSFKLETGLLQATTRYSVAATSYMWRITKSIPEVCSAERGPVNARQTLCCGYRGIWPALAGARSVEHVSDHDTILDVSTISKKMLSIYNRICFKIMTLWNTIALDLYTLKLSDIYTIDTLCYYILNNI